MRTRSLAAGLATLLLLAGLAATGGPTHAAPPTCENGVVVENPDANRGLVIDCANLLGAKTLLSAATPLNWSGETPIAEWDGVTVGGEPPRVEGLDLSSCGLMGRIAPQLGRLTALRTLSLHDNHLTGPIPVALGELRSIESLSLHGNELSGPIPPELGALHALRSLELHDNRLTGSIPEQLGNLHELRVLSLSDNQLTGSIPEALGSLANLETLRLDRNG